MEVDAPVRVVQEALTALDDLEDDRQELVEERRAREHACRLVVAALGEPLEQAAHLLRRALVDLVEQDHQVAEARPAGVVALAQLARDLVEEADEVVDRAHVELAVRTPEHEVLTDQRRVQTIRVREVLVEVPFRNLAYLRREVDVEDARPERRVVCARHRLIGCDRDRAVRRVGLPTHVALRAVEERAHD